MFFLSLCSLGVVCSGCDKGETEEEGYQGKVKNYLEVSGFSVHGLSCNTLPETGAVKVSECVADARGDVLLKVRCEGGSCVVTTARLMAYGASECVVTDKKGDNL